MGRETEKGEGMGNILIALFVGVFIGYHTRAILHEKPENTPVGKWINKIRSWLKAKKVKG